MKKKTIRKLIDTLVMGSLYLLLVIGAVPFIELLMQYASDAFISDGYVLCLSDLFRKYDMTRAWLELYFITGLYVLLMEHVMDVFIDFSPSDVFTDILILSGGTAVFHCLAVHSTLSVGRVTVIAFLIPAAVKNADRILRQYTLRNRICVFLCIVLGYCLIRIFGNTAGMMIMISEVLSVLMQRGISKTAAVLYEYIAEIYCEEDDAPETEEQKGEIKNVYR